MRNLRLAAVLCGLLLAVAFTFDMAGKRMPGGSHGAYAQMVAPAGVRNGCAVTVNLTSGVGYAAVPAGCDAYTKWAAVQAGGATPGLYALAAMPTSSGSPLAAAVGVSASTANAAPTVVAWPVQ